MQIFVVKLIDVFPDEFVYDEKNLEKEWTGLSHGRLSNAGTWRNYEAVSVQFFSTRSIWTQ